ncbi:putative peptidylarginine deiminase [Purpureocillium lavendulum]|uniref:Peptidylarginine deiminase n=1 Tax=Purpureocillium lavendulum TaxID=1247861 RepID=A0AB34FC24_9HYPO|nr:putative peptidylarginine deiminase [Purpureocillium lavendulum]
MRPLAAILLALDLIEVSHALKTIIVADTNRDGEVDITGNSDTEGKDVWSEESGALFLANIGDTDFRCSSKITATTPSNKELDNCNDASDNVLRSPTYLAPVRTVPNLELSDSATASIVVKNSTAASKVRIFHRVGKDWTYVTPNYTFNGQDLRAGLDLGIDARDVRRSDAWDGRATLELKVEDGCEVAKDSVTLRVAPVMVHHHGQLLEQVFATAGGDSTVQSIFVQVLREITARAGVKKPLFAFNMSDSPEGFLDPWAQDFFEAGYTSIPGPDGPIVLRIMVRSAQDDRWAGRLVFRDLRSNSVGAVQHHVSGGTTDSTGNLETIPPYTHNGKSYPAGRIVMGSQFGVKPLIVKFFEAQEVQTPVEINTSWLSVGHTDEFMQFLPADNRLGWVMAVSDPLAGLRILENAQKAGHGKVMALSRPSFATDGISRCLPNDTIEEVLSKANFTGIQKYCADNIQANIEIIKRETGITDNGIIRIPSLFYSQPWTCEIDTKTLNIIEAAGHMTKLNLLRRQSDAIQVTAFYPETINGIVLSNSQYVAPNPWGPIIDGKDIIAEAVSAAYAKINYNVSYMDDWFSHHTGDGEVHCGSNAIRDAFAQWW